VKRRLVLRGAQTSTFAYPYLPGELLILEVRESSSGGVIFPYGGHWQMMLAEGSRDDSWIDGDDVGECVLCPLAIVTRGSAGGGTFVIVTSECDSDVKSNRSFGLI